jgi:hypothetical protein
MGKVQNMRLIVIAFWAFAGIGAAASPASAQSTVSPYPFCIRSDDYQGWSGCTFNSFGECQAAASGIQAECLANPWYSPGTQAAPPPATTPFGGNLPVPIGPPPD